MELNVHTCLVSQLTKGSEEAFTQLYELYSAPIYGFALRLTKSSADAENILQETFIRVWDNRAKISSKRSFKSYLFTIAYHLVIDHFRQQINSVDFENFIASDYYQLFSDNNTEQQITIEDYHQLLAQSIAKLSPRQQEIFRMSREEQLSDREIGERLGISDKTVYNQISLILATLKADLLVFSFFLLIN